MRKTALARRAAACVCALAGRLLTRRGPLPPASPPTVLGDHTCGLACLASRRCVPAAHARTLAAPRAKRIHHDSLCVHRVSPPCLAPAPACCLRRAGARSPNTCPERRFSKCPRPHDRARLVPPLPRAASAAHTCGAALRRACEGGARSHPAAPRRDAAVRVGARRRSSVIASCGAADQAQPLRVARARSRRALCRRIRAGRRRRGRGRSRRRSGGWQCRRDFASARRIACAKQVATLARAARAGGGRGCVACSAGCVAARCVTPGHRRRTRRCACYSRRRVARLRPRRLAAAAERR
jgi:hypothetical protein